MTGMKASRRSFFGLLAAAPLAPVAARVAASLPALPTATIGLFELGVSRIIVPAENVTVVDGIGLAAHAATIESSLTDLTSSGAVASAIKSEAITRADADAKVSDGIAGMFGVPPDQVRDDANGTLAYLERHDAQAGLESVQAWLSRFDVDVAGGP